MGKQELALAGLTAVFIIIVITVSMFQVLWRLDQTRKDCEQNQRFYDTTAAVIEESFKPGPQGNAIDRLKIPEGTPPQVIAILAQLGTAENPPDRASEQRIIAKLGERPEC